MELPAASVNLPLSTLITPAVVPAFGVKVAVYTRGLFGSGTKVPKLPPVTVTLSFVKSLEASLRVKVIVAVSPTFRLASSLVITIVGGTVSTGVIASLTNCAEVATAISRHALSKAPRN